jgi:hypothetical protein
VGNQALSASIHEAAGVPEQEKDAEQRAAMQNATHVVLARPFVLQNFRNHHTASRLSPNATQNQIRDD